MAITILNSNNNGFVAGAGNDVIAALGGNDVISGFLGDDMILGGLGHDTLRGGNGRDVLDGGSGNDMFDYDSLTDSTIGTAGRDVITDFEILVGDNDTIDLRHIDANTNTGADNVFLSYNEGAALPAGRPLASLFFNTTTHLLFGQVDGGAAYDFAIELPGVSAATLNIDDFIL